jgi:hypothetical protein
MGDLESPSVGEATPTPNRWGRSFLRSSPGIGLATMVVAVPLILAVPKNRAWVVAFVALCIYPVIDAARNAIRRPWWLWAFVSAVVWFVVMGVLVGVADARAPLHESSMVFIVPAAMFPAVLLVSGLVRLERRLRGKPQESGLKIATVLGGAVCGLMIGVPTLMNTIPAVIENYTGNTPPNTTYSGSEAEVVEADSRHVSVRLASGPKSYRLTPETRFGFLGPGLWPADNPAGPAWLKPGQKVRVDYAFREHVAHANYIAVWIDRKGCAGDERWTSMPAPAADAGLAGSTWEGRRTGERPDDPPTTFELLPAGRLTFRDGDTAYKNPAGGWRKAGQAVVIQVNDCYALYEGRIDGDRITGEFSNERGFRQPWTARRMTVQGDAGIAR